MKINIHNLTEKTKYYQEPLERLYEYAKSILGFSLEASVVLESDLKNSKNIFGKTAFYNPNKHSIHLFYEGRHPKDVLRSFAHELVHHNQNCENRIKYQNLGDGAYAQNDEELRELEREAYEKGNLIFRDWEDQTKYFGDQNFISSANTNFRNTLYETLVRKFTI